jgi:hypothetical protein
MNETAGAAFTSPPTPSPCAPGFDVSLANERKRLYSFVRKFLTKRWFCDGDANQTEQHGAFVWIGIANGASALKM